MLDSSKPTTGLRRTHRKSRSGCKTCRGRHIRCDEKTPVCRNCERSGRQCHYVTTHKVESDQQMQSYGLLYLYPQIEPAKLPSQEVFLLQHLATFSSNAQFIDNKYSSWMRRIPTMMGEHRFLLDCVLGLSAAHHLLSKTTPGSPALTQLALHYRGRGMRGLQAVLNNFSEGNADAALAASIILTWYQCDWKEWSSLAHGIRTIQGAMRSFKENSCFINLIEAQEVIPERFRPLPPGATESESPALEHVEALNELILRLQDVKQYVSGHEDEERTLDQITGFAKMLQSKLPMTSTSEQFESSRMIRIFTATLPPKILERLRREPTTLIASAYFFAATLTVEPLFPAMGSMFFAYIALQPLYELGTFLEEQRNDPVASARYDWDEAARLMAYPKEAGQRFRARVGWPTISRPPIPINYG